MENVWEWKTYFLILGVVASGCIFMLYYDKRGNKAKDPWLILGLLPTFMLLALREKTVGGDLVRYERYIERLEVEKLQIDGIFSEPLTGMIAWISSRTNGIYFFIPATAIITYVFIFIALKRMHNKGYAVTPMFVLFFAFICIRACSMVANGMALAASLCAYTYLYEDDDQKSRGTKWFLFFSVMALGFHVASIINFAVFAICKYPKKGRNQNLYIAVQWLGLISLVALVFMLSQGIFYNYISTVANGEYKRFVSTGGFGIGNTAVRLPLLCLSLYLYETSGREQKKELYSLLNLVGMSIIIAQLKYVNQDYERFTLYTDLGLVLIMPLVYKRYRSRYFGYLQLVYFVFLFVYLSMYIYIWKGCIMPYLTILR